MMARPARPWPRPLAEAARTLAFLGEVPIDPRVAESGDAGEPMIRRHTDSPAAKAYLALAGAVIDAAANAKMQALPEVAL